jgi:hypothetical protein
VIRVAPWGAAQEAESVRLPRSLYHSIKERERVCMVVKQGALGINWYSAQACPWNGRIDFF